MWCSKKTLRELLILLWKIRESKLDRKNKAKTKKLEVRVFTFTWFKNTSSLYIVSIYDVELVIAKYNNGDLRIITWNNKTLHKWFINKSHGLI